MNSTATTTTTLMTLKSKTNVIIIKPNPDKFQRDLREMRVTTQQPQVNPKFKPDETLSKHARNLPATGKNLEPT
jgi:hypothetical protein